jgi:5-formyltetrahydrofolate cyclo-ligase
VPVGTEPGGASLPALLAEHCTLLLPILRPDGDLDWAPYDGQLRRSARGLFEPAGGALGTSAILQASLILVPALAVSSSGMRLGRGGGSYDRVLTRVRSYAAPGAVPPASPLIVALLHDGELLDEVPHEPHDRPVDAVITPTGGLTLISGWTK